MSAIVTSAASRDCAAAAHTGEFHVLALSGGGFRALYTATVLKGLEEALGAPLAQRFDLVCGTSAGGLLALGLASEVPAAELQAMFEKNRRRIFGSQGFLRRLFGKWLLAKHSSSGLQSVLHERFGTTTIGDLKHRVLIPAVNCSSGKSQVFKTPHAAAFHTDHLRTLVDIGLATTAAPTYFPLHEIPGEGVFADGGLFGNSPGFFGLHEAQRVFNVPATRVRVLAIGTMALGAALRGASARDRGIVHWGSSLFDLVMAAQESTTNAMLGHWLNDRFYPIDEQPTGAQSKDVSALDAISAGTVEVLKTRGALAAKRALGDPAFAPFKAHVASEPTFFYGANKNLGGL
jgi:predicted acylesterase/phospholipase RssA